jgi:hypothetical protein
MRKLIEEFGWIALVVFIIAMLVLGTSNSLKSTSRGVATEGINVINNIDLNPLD